jgi:hypothetical protein
MYGLPNMNGTPTYPGTPNEWFDPSIFTAVPSGTFGNEVRNQLRGPGFQTFDLTVQRNIRLSGRYTVTLRLDSFNLFNTTNFGLPARNLSSTSDLATITSLSGDARITQLAIRFTF